jgi:hypothetical protein
VRLGFNPLDLRPLVSEITGSAEPACAKD